MVRRCRAEATALQLSLRRERGLMAERHGATPTPFERKNIRLATENYRGRRMYFLTLCFEKRKAFGRDRRVALWLIQQLKKFAADFGFFVHAYCVMPDHMHVLVSASSDDSNLMKFVENYKQETGFAAEQRTKERLWQFKYYDRILRNSDSPESVAWYIWMNPVRNGLCEVPMEYPFLGSFTEVGARMLKGSAAPEWRPPWKKKELNVAPSL